MARDDRRLSPTSTETDDERTRQAKLEVLRPTIDRLWHTVVTPFMNMRITDAEIVTLHLLLMWSSNSEFSSKLDLIYAISSDNRHVCQQTREFMRKRREWAIERLLEHYEQIRQPDPMIRLGEILLSLPEIEVVCNMHCKHD